MDESFLSNAFDWLGSGGVIIRLFRTFAEGVQDVVVGVDVGVEGIEGIETSVVDAEVIVESSAPVRLDVEVVGTEEEVGGGGGVDEGVEDILPVLLVADVSFFVSECLLTRGSLGLVELIVRFS